MKIRQAELLPAGFRKMRLKMGLKTQSELAERLGISVAAVSAWEKGNRHPSYNICGQLLGMGASVEDLFGVIYMPVDVSAEASGIYPNAGDIRLAMRIMDERLQKLENSSLGS